MTFGCRLQGRGSSTERLAMFPRKLSLSLSLVASFQGPSQVLEVMQAAERLVNLVVPGGTLVPVVPGTALLHAIPPAYGLCH
eukprot:343837-Rhodomonas_salina.1